MFEDLKEKYSFTDEQVEELTKVVQSETDKVRTKYTTEIKELEKFKPIEKTEEQIELEKAKAELNELKFKTELKSKGINEEFAMLLKTDCDLSNLSTLLTQSNDYVAKNHSANMGVTKEQFDNMDYSARAKLYSENPQLYAELSK